MDIREESGSTSAIYAEYLMDDDLRFSGSDEHESRLATALMHGIRSDTDNFINARAPDYLASQFFGRFRGSGAASPSVASVDSCADHGPHTDRPAT